MRFILRGKKLLEMSGLENAHQLALRSQVSYPTVDRYVNRPETIVVTDLSILAAILERGCGLSHDQIANLAISDLFVLLEE
jgi:hypothetical protein